MVTAGTHTSIRTPDQRIRVFVSSTLRELADERRAVRSAIEQLQLAPVMFELGARPARASRALPVLPRAERCVRRDLRRQLWVGRSGGADLGARGRVRPRAAIHAEAHLHQEEHHPRGSPQGSHRADPDRRHRRIPTVRDRRRTGEPGGGRPRHPAGRALRGVALVPRDARRVLTRRAGAGPVHDHDRPRARDRRRAPAARPRQRPGGQPDRPGRDRQEPPRDRGRDRGTRRVPRRHLLRRPGERARTRAAAPHDRLRARHPRQRRSGARGAHLARPRRPSRAARARQLRADRRRRTGARPALHGRTDCELPGDQPHRAADQGRAGLRRACADDAGARRPRNAGARSAVRRSDPVRRPGQGGQALVRAHGRERRRGHGHLPPPRRASPGRSNLRPRSCGCSRRPTSRSGSSAACRCSPPPCGISPTGTARCARRSIGASACCHRRTAICSRTSASSPSGSRSRRWKPSGPGGRGTGARSTGSRRSSTARW